MKAQIHGKYQIERTQKPVEKVQLDEYNNNKSGEI